jgi:tRNA dimethylallyltransferase
MTASEFTPIFLAGSTASGKSAVALELAARLGGEIISVDSMQVYRGLDLGTAKPTAAERARVPHHLIDLAELSEPFDAARFVELAGLAVAEIQTRGRVPIFCGGTGLYFKAWLEGLGTAPPTDAALRAALEATPLEVLLKELEAKDPATFQAIDRRNPRRVVRAIEVIRLTGRTFSEQRAEWKAETKEKGKRKKEKMFGLERAPDDLRQRINVRVDAMFRDGLVDETRRLLECGLAQNRTAMQAIGYRQVVEHLRGERPLPETVVLVKQKTWQFARRQGTWFRNQFQLRWLEVKPDESASQTCERIMAVTVQL